MNRDLHKHLMSIINSASTQINFFEEGINHVVLTKFLKALKRIPSADDETALLNTELQNINPTQEQLRVIVQMAKHGSIGVLRKLETFIQQLPDGNMREWTKLAIMYCRLQIENELLDQPIGFIASGLGGKGNKLRYYVVLVAKQPLNDYLANTVKDAYEQTCQQYDSELESLEWQDNYLIIKLLAAFQHFVNDIIEAGINEAGILESYYIVTNMSKPSYSDIEEWAQNIEEQKQAEEQDTANTENYRDNEFDEQENYQEYGDGDDDDDDDDEDGDDDDDYMNTYKSIRFINENNNTPPIDFGSEELKDFRDQLTSEIQKWLQRILPNNEDAISNDGDDDIDLDLNDLLNNNDNK